MTALDRAGSLRGMTKSTFQTRVRARRTELQLTQAQVAKACKVSNQSVQQWEDDGPNGSMPRLPKLKLLASALRTTVDYLLTGHDSDNPSPESDAFATRRIAATPEESQLLETYRQLGTEGRAHILGALTERYFREHPTAAIEGFARLGLLSNLEETGNRKNEHDENNPNKRLPKPGRKRRT